jgi:hypothetical protein
MNRIFGFSRNAVALAGIVVAIILVVLVGMIILGSAAIRALMAPGIKLEGVSLLALLITIIVLLTANFILLLVLFWCCCRKVRTGKEGEMPPDLLAVVLPLLPLFRQLPKLLGDLGLALYESGKTIAWLKGRVDAASTAFGSVATAAGNATTARLPALEQVTGGWLVVATPFNPTDFDPVQDLVSSLNAASTSVSAATGGNVFVFQDQTQITVDNVSTVLVDTGKALAKVAKRLDQTLPIKADLLTPP